MKKDWVYYGIFFSEEMKKTILKYAEKLMDIFSCPSDHEFKFREDWKIYCDHVTIVFNDCSETSQLVGNYCEKHLGENVVLPVVGIGISNRAIALEVDYKTTNEHSHITIAIAPDAKPVESNNIKTWHKINKIFTVTGTIDKYPSKNN